MAVGGFVCHAQVMKPPALPKGRGCCGYRLPPDPGLAGRLASKGETTLELVSHGHNPTQNVTIWGVRQIGRIPEKKLRLVSVFRRFPIFARTDTDKPL